MTILQLDIDARLSPKRRAALQDRVRFVSRTVNLPLTLDVIEKTKRGFHAVLSSPVDMSPVLIVAIQCLLGSDFKRETFNLQRVLILGGVSAFWRKRWNVLYTEKLQRGKP